MERLQKYISRCGIASRRQGERMITEGRVRVNGKLIKEMGVLVDESTDKVTVDGRMIRPIQTNLYIMLNKPKEVICTCQDPQERTTVLDLLPDTFRVYPIGRLDYMTEGLLLLTNDGDFANQLTHPRYEINKTYRVVVKGLASDKVLESLRHGVELDDGITLPAIIELESRNDQISVFLITIREGRNRQVRRMCQSVGLHVYGLQRTQVGSLVLGDLSIGDYRNLTEAELAKLKELVKE